MHLVVSDYPNNVERLLDFKRQAFRYERAYISVQILARLSKSYAKLLYYKPQESSTATLRGAENRPCFFIVRQNVLGKIWMGRRRSTKDGILHNPVDPNRELVAMVTYTNHRVRHRHMARYPADALKIINLGPFNLGIYA